MLERLDDELVTTHSQRTRLAVDRSKERLGDVNTRCHEYVVTILAGGSKDATLMDREVLGRALPARPREEMCNGEGWATGVIDHGLLVELRALPGDALSTGVPADFDAVLEDQADLVRRSR